jgi:hypothetical protein
MTLMHADVQQTNHACRQFLPPVNTLLGSTDIPPIHEAMLPIHHIKSKVPGKYGM